MSRRTPPDAEQLDMVAVVGALAGTFASEMVGLQNTVRALLIALLVLYSARGIRALARSR